MTLKILRRMVAGVVSSASLQRNRLFDAGRLEQIRVSKPVISIGNLTVGGTGKTPVTLALAKLLTARGKKVGVISRNYQAEIQEMGWVLRDQPNGAAWFGDEPFLVARALPEAAVFVGPSKSETAAWAVSVAPELDVLLIDDGFQHRRLHRDLDLVLVDATDPETFEAWPLGRGREGIAGLARADLILVTKCNWTSPADLAACKARLPSGIPVVEVAFETLWPEIPRDKALGVFAGIARPQVFFDLAKKKYFGQIKKVWPLRDHQKYDESVIQSLVDFLEAESGSLLLTTEKDGVKLLDSPLKGRLRTVGLEAHFRQEEDLLEKIVALFR